MKDLAFGGIQVHIPHLFSSKATYITLRSKLCIVIEHASTHIRSLFVSLSLSPCLMFSFVSLKTL